MSNYNLIAVVSINTVISIGLAIFWYSYYGLARLYIDAYFGGEAAREKLRKRHTEQTINYLSILSPLLYNILLVFIINNIYAPHTFNDALAMSLVLTAVHVLLELPHLGYENRSYTALIVHTGYHFLQTLLPLLVIQNFFAFPRLPSLKI